MHRRPARLQPRADHRLGRPFAIGACDMDHRRQAVLGVAQGRKQPPDPVQVRSMILGCSAIIRSRITSESGCHLAASSAAAISVGGSGL